jgi:hypothetical protein
MMTSARKKAVELGMCRVILAALSCGFGVVCSLAYAAAPNGTWKFDRSADYDGRVPPGLVSRFDTIVVRDGEARFSADCAVRFHEEEYFFSDVFQSLTKADVTEKQADAFLKKKLGVSLIGVKDVYVLANAPATCAQPVMEFFAIGDRLLIPFGGTFYSYVRQRTSNAETSAVAGAMPSLLSNYKVTRLPLDYDRYFSRCRPKLQGPNGRPRTTDRCAPDFYPYVADPTRHDPLMDIIGSHDYAMNGQQYTEGFSPPFRQKVAATFLVFPPMKQVVLVRVDDFDIVRNEDRDVMSGVYLSIIDRKVVDQIEGCQFDRDYVCRVEGTAVAKLTDNGKFEHVSHK